MWNTIGAINVSPDMKLRSVDALALARQPVTALASVIAAKVSGRRGRLRRAPSGGLIAGYLAAANVGAWRPPLQQQLLDTMLITGVKHVREQHFELLSRNAGVEDGDAVNQAVYQPQAIAHHDLGLIEASSAPGGNRHVVFDQSFFSACAKLPGHEEPRQHRQVELSRAHRR